MAGRSLKALEAKIESNVKNYWYETGAILIEIRDRELYKKNYGTFEGYIKDRWGWERRHGYRLIEAAEISLKIEHQNVSKKGDFGHIEMPTSEGQIRPLTSLSNDAEKVHVWKKATETAKLEGKRVTAEVVEKAVEDFMVNPEPVEPIIEPRKKLVNASSNKAEVLYAPGENDECYTPEYGVKAILPHLVAFRGQVIWCPFDKANSQFVKVLTNAGFDVVYSHLDSGGDFYDYEPDHWDVIVSNPPFTNKRQIFERALSFGKPFALIMSNTWLNDAAPKQIFKDRGLQLLMFEERMKFLNQDNSENRITFSSSYFCCDFLVHDIMFDSLKEYGYGL